jgi:hypothetical protein
LVSGGKHYNIELVKRPVNGYLSIKNELSL